jgi:hypothetical protein
MDASSTIASSGGYRTEDCRDADEESLFGRKQAGNKAEGQDRNR